MALVTRFLRKKVSFPACVSGLADTLVRIKPQLKPENAEAIRVLVLANNELVIAEMARRGSVEREN